MQDSQLTPDGQQDVHSYIMRQIARNERAASRARKAADRANRDSDYAVKRGRAVRKSH